MKGIAGPPATLRRPARRTFRPGLTFTGSIGAGVSANTDSGDQEASLYLNPRLGYRLSRRWSLQGDLLLTLRSPTFEQQDRKSAAGILGLGAQFFVLPRFWLSAAVGPAFMQLPTGDGQQQSAGAVGVIAGLGVKLLNLGAGWGLTAELRSAVFVPPGERRGSLVQVVGGLGVRYR